MKKGKINKLINETVQEIRKLISLVNNEEKEREFNDRLKKILKTNKDDYIYNSLLNFKHELFIYCNFINFNTYFDNEYEKVSSNNIGKEIINNITDIAIYILNKIKKDKLNNIDIVKDSLYTLYEKMYRIMKCELLFSNDSLIYNYVKDNKDIRIIFEKLVSKDFKKLKKDVLNETYVGNNKDILKQILYFESFDNIFDINIIKFLSMEDVFNLRYIENIEYEVEKVFNSLKTYSDLYIKYSDLYIDSDDSFTENRNNYMKNKNELKVRLCSIGISLSMIATTMFGLSSSIKDSSVSKVYNDTSTKYSTIDKKETRTLFSYDVSDYTYSNTKDYLNIDLPKLDYNIFKLDYDNSTTRSKYLEVIDTKIDKNNEINILDKNTYYKNYAIIVLGLELLLSYISFYFKFIIDKKYKVDLGIIMNLYDIFAPTCDCSKSLYENLKEEDKEIKRLSTAKDFYRSRAEELLPDLMAKVDEFITLFNKNMYVLKNKPVVDMKKEEEKIFEKVRKLQKMYNNH